MATPPLSSIQEVVYVKTQGAVGTGVTFDQTTDKALRVTDCTFTAAGNMLQRRTGTKSASGIEPTPVMGGLRWDIALTVELYPWSSYTDLDTSPASPIWKCATQLALATTPNRVRARFGARNLLGTDLLPMTLERHEIGGNRYRATDVTGHLSGMAMEANGIITCTFALQGLWADPVASTFTQALVDYGTAQVPAVFRGATLVTGMTRSNGSTAQEPIDLRTFALTPAMTVVERPDTLSGNVEGYAPSFVTRTGSGDEVAFSATAGAEGDSAGDTSVWANWLAQAQGRSFSLVVNEGSGGMKITVTMPEVHYNTPTPSTAMPYREYDLSAFGTDAQTGATYSGLEITFEAGT